MDLDSFIAQLDSKAACPKCFNSFTRVKQHARFCFKNVNDFTPFLPSNQL
jgi:hypothetical protein